MKRRDFLALAAGTVIAAADPLGVLTNKAKGDINLLPVDAVATGNPVPAVIESPTGLGGGAASLTRLSESSSLTPVVKNFSEEWIASLPTRGTPKVYTAENSAQFAYIGMPVGGIGAGQVYLGGDGKLWWWDIFNTRASRWPNDQWNAYVHPYLANDSSDSHQYTIQQGFILRLSTPHGGVTKHLDKTGFSDIEFVGQYPIGTTTYLDKTLPVKVTLNAFSPFIPGNVDDSTLPATVMQFTVANTSEQVVSGDITGFLENAVCIVSGALGSPERCNQILRRPHASLVQFSIVDQPLPDIASPQPAIVFDDFKSGTYDNWTVEGDAFGTKPPKAGDIYHSEAVQNEQGQYMADSFLGGSDNATGKLTSKTFTVNRAYVNFLIGGGNHPGSTCMNLVVDGKIVRTATGADTETLNWTTWNVSLYSGKMAYLEIIDNESGGWGHILVDNIELADLPRQNLEEMKSTPDYGTMALASMGLPGTTFAAANVELGDLPGVISGASPDSATRSYDETVRRPLIGTAVHTFNLRPGQSATLNFVLSWNFPGPENIGISSPMRRGYSTRFSDAAAVVDYIQTNFERLSGQTKLWRDTWYDSTLPLWFLDRTFLNTSILATSTAHLLSDGRFYGYEGMYSCPGTCTHVWGYVQAMGRLFSGLDKSMLEHDHLLAGVGMNPDGGIGMRSEIDHTPAVDGQSDVVLRSYLAHQMSADNSFLQRNYASIKSALEYLRSKNDPDGTGTLVGSQHNTLDAEYFTRTAWLTLNYQAALLAMAEMADDMGDAAYASTLREIQLKGRAYAESNLFNGEYFYQEKDPTYPKTTGTYDGCEYSQLVGQNWAHQVGCGPVVDPEKSITALNSIWKYSFATDVGPYTKVFGTGRPFVLPGEGGIIGCTWPRGNDSINVAYLNECQAGYEYACSATMMWEGLVDKALAHIRTVHERYDGSKRNPWNEVEAGSHYSRSMASYGLFIAACGFEYHGPRGHIAFVPRLTPENFRAPFTVAEGWGTFAQKRVGTTQSHSLKMVLGKVRLKSIAIALPAGAAAARLKVSLGDKTPVPAKFVQKGQRVTVVLSEHVTVEQGQSFNIVIVQTPPEIGSTAPA